MTPFWRAGKRTVIVLTGTDVHPFERICAWADRWAVDHPDHDVVVQHGYTTPPRAARSVDMLTPSELEEALEGADVAVTHGGPGTISTVRRAGLLPVVLPRNPAYGEHVDGHQMRFAVWAGTHNLATIVSEPAALDDAVAAAFLNSRGDGPDSQIEATVDRVGELLAKLAAGQTRRRAVPRLTKVVTP